MKNLFVLNFTRISLFTFSLKAPWWIGVSGLRLQGVFRQHLSSATVEKFAYDLMGNAWADLDSGGSLTTRRLYERAIDALFARIDSVIADWYLTGRLGSVRDIMNNSSSSIYHADYDGFGNITSETNPSNGDRYNWI